MPWKITEVEVYVVDPTQGSLTYNEEPQNVWTFVRVLTDAGVHGWGESTNFPANGSLIVADAIRHLRPWIVGEDAADITAMWHRLFRKATYLGPRGLPTAVVSGIDIALWDIKGKVAGRPMLRPARRQGPRQRPALRQRLVRRLDGQPACATPEEYAAAARRVVGRGHTRGQARPVPRDGAVPHRLPRRADLAPRARSSASTCVAAMRDAVGPEVEILIDAHGHYNVPTAVRLARRLEPYRIGWFEEPDPPESLAGAPGGARAGHRADLRRRAPLHALGLPAGVRGAAGGLPDAGCRLDGRDQRSDADRRRWPRRTTSR